MAIDPNKSHAFLSYTRFDDDYLEGGVTWLRDALEKAVQARTGFPFQIFQDVEDIQPGNNWAKKLDQALEAAQLVIPVLTPSFFKSEFCRREAKGFLDYEARAGRGDLILPLYLIRAPILEDLNFLEADDLAKALRERQYDDWRSLTAALQHVDTRWQLASRTSTLAETIAGVVGQEFLAEMGTGELEQTAKVSSISTFRSQPAEINIEAGPARNHTGYEPDAGQVEKVLVERGRRCRRDEQSTFESDHELKFREAFCEHDERKPKHQELREENESLDFAPIEGEAAASSSEPKKVAGPLIRHAAIILAGLIVVGIGVWWNLLSHNEKVQLRTEIEGLQIRLQAAKATIFSLRRELAATGVIYTENDRYRPLETFRDCKDGCPDLVVIPAGEFLMGSHVGEVGRWENEGPLHEVTISAPFALCKYEITFSEWDACVEADGCDYIPDDEGWGRGDRPVVNVSWQDTQMYLAWISQQTGASYRLPTEAEWEYSARAMTTDPYSTGKTIATDQANFDGSNPTPLDHKGDYRRMTLSVGSFDSNPFGLYDVHGNVWEWVEDHYVDNYSEAPSDGRAWLQSDGILRVLRGGSWLGSARHARTAYRIRDADDARNASIGFRCARSLK